MKKILLALLFLSAAALAQTVPVSAVLTDGSGNVVPGAYLHFALWNCGANIPVVSGTGSIVQTAFDLKQPGGGGTITGVILGNDQIKCGNVASTQWLVTPMSRQGQPITSAQRYNICSSSAPAGSCAQVGGPGATFDPSTAQPSVTVAPNPGYIQVFGNPLSGQTITQPAGTTLNVFGNMNLNGSAVCTTAICPGGGGGGPPAFYTNLFLNSVQNKLGLNAGAGITLVNDASGNTLITNTNTNVGTVTGVTCGPGLSGGTFSTTGTCAISAPLSVAFGGTGTTSPGLIAGTNVTISGAWPNQTINSSGGGGGGGTGGQYQTAVFNPSNTAVGVGPGIAGQSYISQGGASLPQFASTGLAGRFFLTGTTDQFLCDTSGLTGTTKDRYKRIFINTGGAVTETIPDAGSGGCGGNFTFGVMVGNGTTATINRSSISTFTVCNGSACPSGLTTFTLNAGQYATINSPDNVNYWVVVSPGGGGLTGIAPQQAVFSATNIITGQAKPVYDVRDYSLVGDGSTDNTVAIRSLLTTIGANPATILFTAGTYAFNNIIFPTNVTLDFSAGGSVKAITSGTSPGSAVFVNGTSAECGSATSCTTPSLTMTAGNTLFVGAQPYPGFTFVITKVADSCGDQFFHVQQSLAGQTRNEGAWIASNLIGGSCTVTITANGTLTNSQVIADQFSGMGPIVVADGAGSSAITASTTMSSGSATTTASSLIIGYGGQGFTAETCTAGAGYIQPAGLAGQSTNGYMCSEYNLSGAGGSTSATQTITSAPAHAVYAMLALKPGSATITIQGGIFNPDNHQIFYNATGAAGTIDFTGNYTIDGIKPEWWGASPTASAATNTPALQAAEHGAFGTNRTNSSGLSVYNKPLLLSGNYNINAELTFYDVLNFKVKCDRRLNGGITQNTANLRIIDGQSIAYGSFDDCAWAGAASSTNGLIDLDYNGVTTAGDLAPQFIDFNRNIFNGNNLVDTGVLIAKSGGAAQGSNIYCWDCLGQSFTGAVWQIGGDNTGRNVGRFQATNAIDIGWYGGDMQGNPLYGIASVGGGHIFVRDITFENGFATQTGFDMFLSQGIGTEPFICENARSESRRLISASIAIVKNCYTIDQSTQPVAGTSDPVGTIKKGSIIAGDGQYYKVTTDTPPYSGIGSYAAPLFASGGSGTTLTDTNTTIAGSVTIKLFAVGDALTQTTSGSTATVVSPATSTASVTGTLTSGTCNGTETMTQATSGVTGTEVFPTPNNSGPIPLSMVNLSGTADSSHTWTGGTSGCVFTPSAAPTFSASSMLTTAPTGSPDGTHNWTNVGGSTFVPSGSPTAQAAWTVNAFAGLAVSVSKGTNIGCYGVITSNTATTVTFSGGWLNKYYGLTCGTPDTTSQFFVECYVNGGTTVTCGSMVMTALNENGIDGSNGAIGMSGMLENVTMPGDRINVGNATTLRNVQVTRPDWLPSGGGGWWQTQAIHDWDVHLFQTVASGNAIFYQNWLYSSSSSTRQLNIPFQRDWASDPLTWSCAGPAGGVGSICDAVGIGGRSNPQASDNHLEIFAGGQNPVLLGPPVPQSVTGLNLAGINNNFSCGRSTGSGVGGICQFYGSAAGSSGSTVNADTNLWGTVDSNGFEGVLGGTTPAAVTATSVTSSGIVDGTVPIAISTGTTVNLGAASKTGYYFNQEGTAGTGVTYTLPATAVGKRYCVENSGTTGVVNTGVLTVYPPASSFVIYLGVVNTVGGGGTHGIASGGAAGDSACFAAIDATHWEVTSLKGTWTEN